MNFRTLKSINLKTLKSIDEKMIQELISNNPTILGLGDLVLKDKERIQSTGGRMDLLFQTPDMSKRYEIELQLGKTDESHIIRTIEYWDIERKRYPEYDHCAVIIAEDFNSRFFNIIQLFNNHIPLIAIKLSAFELNEEIGLSFTKILDVSQSVSNENDIEITDRKYWLQKSSEEKLKQVDEILKLIKEVDIDFELKYNKPYIGLCRKGRVNNFALMVVNKFDIKLKIKFGLSEEEIKEIDKFELGNLEYSSRENRYVISIQEEYLSGEKRSTLKSLLEASYNEWC